MPKILIIRFSSIGDIVLTSPVVRYLKTQVKNAEVHYLTKKSFQMIVENNHYIDKVHFLDKNFYETINILKAEKFDYIIDLHHNLRTSLVKLHLKSKSFSFDKLNFKKWLLVNFKFNSMPKLHIVDRYVDTLKNFNIKKDEKGLDFFIPKKDEIALSKISEKLTHKYIVFVIGAKHQTKRLPNEKIISICKKINFPIILLGGKEDKKNALEIFNCVKKNNFQQLIFNVCGDFNLNQSASIVKQAELIITHDTGLMHIASAFHKKIISIWGNTVKEFGMYPYLSNKNSKIIEVENLSCRPCSKIGYNKCPKKHFKCMNDIDENQIIEKVLSSLKNLS